LLERRVDWRTPRLAGAAFAKGDGKPELAVYSSLPPGVVGSTEMQKM
jgi:hypothetical protein